MAIIGVVVAVKAVHKWCCNHSQISCLKGDYQWGAIHGHPSQATVDRTGCLKTHPSILVAFGRLIFKQPEGCEALCTFCHALCSQLPWLSEGLTVIMMATIYIYICILWLIVADTGWEYGWWFHDGLQRWWPPLISSSPWELTGPTASVEAVGITHNLHDT